MIRALGYSHGVFDPADPGRLCRGRERWIEGFPVEAPSVLRRLVVSGAAFSDDSAHDARRGVAHSGVGPGGLLDALFRARTLVGWAEDAHPAAIPAGVSGVEHYELMPAGGPLRRWSCRWAIVLPPGAPERADRVDQAVAAGADCFFVLPDAPNAAPGPYGGADAPSADGEPRAPGLPEALARAFFLITGARQEGPPARRFQASALPIGMQVAEAVVLVHQDKHAPCVGVYTEHPFEAAGTIEALAAGGGALGVAFAIPPMLARWDRALWELRQTWSEAERGEFPVPPARGGGRPWRRGVAEE